jgi:hypothetical protein
MLPALEHDDFQMLFIATAKPRCRVMVKYTWLASEIVKMYRKFPVVFFAIL